MTESEATAKTDPAQRALVESRAQHALGGTAQHVSADVAPELYDDAPEVHGHVAEVSSR